MTLEQLIAECGESFRLAIKDERRGPDKIWEVGGGIHINCYGHGATLNEALENLLKRVRELEAPFRRGSVGDGKGPTVNDEPVANLPTHPTSPAPSERYNPKRPPS